MVRLWRNAWTEFVPFLDYDTEIRTVLCSTNAIESGAHRGTGRSAHRARPPRGRGRDHRRGRRGHRPPVQTGPVHAGGERHHLLLCLPGQGLGPRHRQGAVGGLHRQGGRPGSDQHPPVGGLVLWSLNVGVAGCAWQGGAPAGTSTRRSVVHRGERIRQFTAALDPELSVHVLQPVLDGTYRDDQLSGDIFVRPTRRGELRCLPLRRR